MRTIRGRSDNETQVELRGAERKQDSRKCVTLDVMEEETVKITQKITKTVGDDNEAVREQYHNVYGKQTQRKKRQKSAR